MFFPIICQTFVKLSVLFTRDIVSRSCPDWLFLVVSIFFVGILILPNILNLWLVFCFILLVILLSFIITHFLLSFFLYHQFDGISNELGMFLDNFLDLLLLEIFGLIFLHLQDNLGSSSKGLTVVLLDCEGASSRRFPDILLIIIVLGGDRHLICH